MADVKINPRTGSLAVPEQGGGYRIYSKEQYQLNADQTRAFIPDVPGSKSGVVYDLPAPDRPLFTAQGVKRAAALGTRNTIEGLASPFTMVGDAANALINLGVMGVNKVAGTEIPTLQLPSRMLNQSLVNAGMPTEQTDAERLLGAGVRAGSGAISTMGAGSIKGVAQAAPEVAAALRTNPVSQTIGGVAGGVAAEGTRQGLQDTQIFENPTADAVAKGFLQLLAGVGAGGVTYLGSRGVANAASATKNAAQGIMDLLTGKGRERIAGQLLRQASGDPNSLAARLSDVPPSEIPGVRPTTAQALGGDTQLSSLELALRNDPAYRHAFDVRAAENQAARTAALDSLSPAGAGSVDDLANGIKQAWAQADDAGRQAILGAQQRAQQRIAELGSAVDQQTAGRIIREELQSAYDASRARTSAAYRAIDPNGAANFAGGEVWDRVAPTIENYFANSTAGTPPELVPIVNRLRNSNNLTFPAINSIRRELSDVAGKAARSGDRTLAAAAGEMADAVAGYVDDAAAQGRGFTPEQAAQYQAARDLRRQQGQIFERGAVGNVLERGPYGEPRLTNSEVPAELFFKGGGSPEATQQFIAAAGNRPRAVQALQDHIATQLRQTVTRPDGSIDAARLLLFRAQHADALRAFPELEGRIANLADAQGMVDQATLAQTARQSEMRGSPLNNFLTKNPTDAVGSIINSRNSEAAIGEVVNQLRGNPASFAAFKRGVVDWINGQIETAGIQPVSGEPIQSFAKLKRLMDTKLSTLRQVFTRDEIQALQSFADQMAAEARVTSAKPMGSNTFANLASRYLVERATNSLAPMTGKNVTALAPSLGWVLRGTDNAVRDAINRALLNPDEALRMVQSAAPLPNRDLISEVLQLGRGLAGQTAIQAQGSR